MEKGQPHIDRRRIVGLFGSAMAASAVAGMTGVTGTTKGGMDPIDTPVGAAPSKGGTGAEPTPASTGATPFAIEIPDSMLQAISRRVADCRFPRTGSTGWDIGPNDAYMRKLAEYWKGSFDWRAQEKHLNRFPQFRAAVAGDLLHFVHVKSPASDGRALVLLHGWPYTFAALLGLVDPLTHPELHGGREADAVDIVIPSLPGFAFSESPSAPLGPRAMAGRIDTLMTDVLGYGSYRAQGGDWGGAIATWLGYEHPRCQAIALNGGNSTNDGLHLGIVDPGLGTISPTERAKDIATQETVQQKSAYFQQQSYRPTTIGYFRDSPVGTAQWIIDKFFLWSDRRTRAFTQIFSMDQLLTEVMLHVATDAFDTSLWIYPGAYAENATSLPVGQKVTQPSGFSAFPDPLLPPPSRADLEKVYNVVQYEKFDHGGHFPFYENPSAFIAGIRNFLRATEKPARV
ncbi:epoxide hydrolase family protein [Streptomyces sp. NPDC004324]